MPQSPPPPTIVRGNPHHHHHYRGRTIVSVNPTSSWTMFHQPPTFPTILPIHKRWQQWQWQVVVVTRRNRLICWATVPNARYKCLHNNNNIINIIIRWKNCIHVSMIVVMAMGLICLILPIMMATVTSHRLARPSGHFQQLPREGIRPVPRQQPPPPRRLAPRRSSIIIILLAVVDIRLMTTTTTTTMAITLSTTPTTNSKGEISTNMI